MELVLWTTLGLGLCIIYEIQCRLDDMHSELCRQKKCRRKYEKEVKAQFDHTTGVLTHIINIFRKENKWK